MRAWWQAFAASVRRGFRLVALFAMLRVAVGLGALLIFDRGAIAWGSELTIIVLAMLAVYVLVALAVRRWAPPRASG